MPISSSALFHFTSSLGYLKNILEHEFRPRFSLEDHSILVGDPFYASDTGSGDEMYNAYPMVCFCDIPLSQTQTHIDTYGKYGIGLSKEWGIAKGITPVIYANPNSAVVESFRGMLDAASNLLRDDGQSRTDFRADLFRLQCFIKPYRGKYWRNEQWNGPATFYDEREWRYVPELRVGTRNWFLKESEFRDQVVRSRATEAIQQEERISFTPSDIRYLIVREEREILELVPFLESVKHKYPPDEVRLLTTRIITVDQIIADF